jgi:hypothetical protein
MDDYKHKILVNFVFFMAIYPKQKIIEIASIIQKQVQKLNNHSQTSTKA